MADFGAALTEAREHSKKVRNAVRRADKAWARLADADVAATARFHGEMDREDMGELEGLVRLARQDNPGAMIEVIVLAHQGADKGTTMDEVTEDQVREAEAKPRMADPTEAPKVDNAEEGAQEAAERHAGGQPAASSEEQPGKSKFTMSVAPGQPSQPDEADLAEEKDLVRPAVKGEVVNLKDSVDLDLDERNVVTVKLGGRVWHAKEPTIDINKELALALPEDGIAGQTSRDGATSALDSIYPQVREVLFDPATGRPPSKAFVDRNLTARGFSKLMQKINEDAAEGNLAGV